MTTTAKGRGKPRPWRGYSAFFVGDTQRKVHSQYGKGQDNCTVYEDGCDPTPAAARRLIAKLLRWHKNYRHGGMELHALSNLRLSEAVDAYLAKSTGAKKGKKK